MISPFTRREFIGATCGFVAGKLLTPHNVSANSNKNTVRIGYLPITDATPLLIAHALGYFEDEGLNAPRPVKVRSWSTLSESFLSDKFNLTHLLLPIPIWMRYKNKSPVKVLAWDHTNGSAITVRTDANMTDFKALGQKQIAVPYWYSMHNVILQLGLRNYGLTPVIQPPSVPLKPHEVNLFILPPPEMPAALFSKKIDGYIVAEPFNAIGEIKVNAKILRFTGDIWKNHPCCVIVMKENIIQQDPIFTQKTINAIVRAQLWLTKNQVKAAHILSREGENYINISKSIIERALIKYDALTYGKGQIPFAIHHPEWRMQRVGFQPYPYPSATRFIFRQLRKTRVEGDNSFLNQVKTDFVINDLVDDRFVKKAIALVGGHHKFSLISKKDPWTREEIIDV